MAIPLEYNLRNLFVRKTATLMTAGGIALVVAVLVLTLALAHGFQETLVATGIPDNVLVIRTGSQTEMQSGLGREVAHIIDADPNVATLPGGIPMVSDESVVLTNLERRSGGTSNITVRGIGEQGLALRPSVRIAEGRPFRPGVDEVMVGRALSRRFLGCQLGSTLRFGSRDWLVVGIFESGGSGFESEIWGDVESLLPAFDRDAYSSVTMRMLDPNAFGTMKERLEADPRLRVDVFLEDDYYSAQSKQLAQVIRVLGMFLVIVMAFGAVFGALNTMYAAVGARTREIGTMLALGFTPANILVSFMIESILLSLVGGLIGCALALPIHGMSTGTTNWSSFSEIAFQFRLTPGILLTGLLASILLGAIGGYFPARNAARRTVTDALREA
jgi:putative ABC transport system permease protein